MDGYPEIEEALTSWESGFTFAGRVGIATASNVDILWIQSIERREQKQDI
jgi:hypothetical protein